MDFINKLKDSKVPPRNYRNEVTMNLYESMKSKDDFTLLGSINEICKILSYNDEFSLNKKWNCHKVIPMHRSILEVEYPKLFNKLPHAEIYVLGVSWYLSGVVDWQKNCTIPSTSISYQGRVVHVGLIDEGREVNGLFYQEISRFADKCSTSWYLRNQEETTNEARDIENPDL
jgi:hypothetical protein